MSETKTSRSTIRSKSRSYVGPIEYVGVAGCSKECQDAVLRYIQFGDRITHVSIVSCSKSHSLIMTLGGVDRVAVKSGFASGYGGEGPCRFSYVLHILLRHGAEIDEYEVSQEFFDRLDCSALTQRDLNFLIDKNRHRPSRLYEYLIDRDSDDARNGALWGREFPSILPYALIDSRIMDLALDFWASPDHSLLIGYRRLEDLIRERSKIKEHGAKLFSQAFDPRKGWLSWSGVDEGERAGRMNLFTATYSAYRNPRAHRESGAYSSELAGEFLLLNHLYRLEREAVETASLRRMRATDNRVSETAEAE